MTSDSDKKKAATIIQVDFRPRHDTGDVLSLSSSPEDDEPKDKDKAVEPAGDKAAADDATTPEDPKPAPRRRASRAKDKAAEPTKDAATDDAPPLADPSSDGAKPAPRRRTSRAKDKDKDKAVEPAGDKAADDGATTPEVLSDGAKPASKRRSRAKDGTPNPDAPDETASVIDRPNAPRSSPPSAGLTAADLDGASRRRRTKKRSDEATEDEDPIVVQEDEKLLRVDFASLHEREAKERARAAEAEAEAASTLSPVERTRRLLAAATHLPEGTRRKLAFFNRAMEMGLATLTVNAAAAGVSLPEHLHSHRSVNLNFSLRFLIPDMDWDERGVRATLSFNQQPFFCDLPWSSVYLIRSRELNEASVDPRACPPELLPSLLAMLRSLNPDPDRS